MLSLHPFLWAVVILVPLLSVGLWATSFQVDMAPVRSLKWWASCPVYPALCALLPLIVCALAADPPPCPHDCSYYNAAPVVPTAV
jgi:hypothetical protein